MGPGSLTKLVPILAGFHGMIHVTDRLGMAIGAQTFDFVERQLGTGGDDQEVIVDDLAVIQFDLVIFRMNPFGADRDEIDVLLFQIRTDCKRDVVTDCASSLPPRDWKA